MVWLWKEWTSLQILLLWSSASSILRNTCVSVFSVLLGRIHFDYACPCYWSFFTISLLSSLFCFPALTFLRNLLSMQRQTRQCSKCHQYKKKISPVRGRKWLGNRKKETSSLLKLRVKAKKNIGTLRCIIWKLLCKTGQEIQEWYECQRSVY